MQVEPKVFGPGTWFTIHTLALKARTRSEMDEFVSSLVHIISHLPCYDCINHATKYLKEHPIIKFYDVGDSKGRRIGMFIYTWKFHNDVNLRLGKPYLDMDTAYSMYTHIPECVGDCGTY